MIDKLNSSKIAGPAVVGILVLLILQTIFGFLKENNASSAPAMSRAENQAAAAAIVEKAIAPIVKDVDKLSAEAAARQSQILENQRAIISELRALADVTKEVVLLVREERRRAP